VNSVDEAIEYTGKILENPLMAEEMGNKGYEIARRDFLSTRHLYQYLQLFLDLTV
jgi:trehalose synthase